jgi:hypothetical protein
MSTTAEEKATLVRIAGDGHAKGVSDAIYAALYHKGLITSKGRISDAGKAHLRAFAHAMKHAPSKRTYVVIGSIVRNGVNMKVGDEFEASPAGTHVQRWLAEGRIEER